MESLDLIATAHQLTTWVSNELQAVLPHGAFICGVIRINNAEIVPVKVITSNFPIEYLGAIRQSDGLFLSPVVKNWLRSDEAQLVDVDWPMDMSFEPTWVKHFKASGLLNIAAHGVVDYSRQHMSYFSFRMTPAHKSLYGSLRLAENIVTPVAIALSTLVGALICIRVNRQKVRVLRLLV